MPTLLLASLFGADVAGLFGLAQRLVTSPLRRSPRRSTRSS